MYAHQILLPKTRDLIFQLQLATLQLSDSQIVSGRMHERFVDLILERLVPSL
jgi:hypothetical protein